mmetsp:Transcript_46841/g.109372  ORF Transcript_46841/g.109372 Transcript_46841/m.109372 type:complete len:123 (-) Transcript_46841:467-835(-)
MQAQLLGPDEVHGGLFSLVCLDISAHHAGMGLEGLSSAAASSCAMEAETSQQPRYVPSADGQQAPSRRRSAQALCTAQALEALALEALAVDSAPAACGGPAAGGTAWAGVEAGTGAVGAAGC